MSCFFTYCCFLQLHATLRDPLLNQAIQFKNIWWHPFKKNMVTNDPVVQSTQQIQLNMFVLVLERVRTVYRRNDIAVRTHMSTKQLVNSSVHHLHGVFLYTGSVLFCEQKWTWILSSHLCKVRDLFTTPIYRRFCERTLVWNTFLSMYSFHSRYSLFIYIYPHFNLVMFFQSTIFTVVQYCTVHSGNGDRMPDSPAFRHLKDFKKVERGTTWTSILQMVNLLFDA